MLIKGGKVFLDDSFVNKDFLIEDSKITKIEDNLDGKPVIDASNLYVLPGLIDIHVHFRDFGEEHKEDWNSGSLSAIYGGVTTAIDMPNNLVPITTVERLKEKDKIVRKKSLVNYGLYIAVTENNVKEINDSDVRYVKLYYGSTTGKISPGNVEKIFKELRKDIVIVAHAEDNRIIQSNEQKYPGGNHSLIRSSEAEYSAVKALLALAKNYKKKLHLTHISSKESISLIRQAKAAGLNITCDTCPHYLFLNTSYYKQLGPFAKVNPALKSKEDNAALWQAMDDTIDCICSDHAPHNPEEKKQGAAGFPGVETTLPLMLTAVNEGRISLESFVKKMTFNPAKIFGLKQGQIKEGKSADLTFVDMDKKAVIRAEELHSKAQWTPFEGFKTKGKAVATIIKGEKYSLGT